MKKPSKPRPSWTYDTMSAAAAATGIPALRLRQAKRAGCPAFRHGRLDLEVFLRWWFGRDTEDLQTDWTRELRKAQAIRERLKARREEGELVDLTEVEALLREWLWPVRELLLATPDEMAARVNPADPEHARAQLDEWMRRAFRVLRGKVEESAEAKLSEEKEAKHEAT